MPLTSLLLPPACSMSSRAIKWANLRKKANKDKKLAVTVFSFPPDKGNVGTAAYLNVFGSIHKASCRAAAEHLLKNTCQLLKDTWQLLNNTWQLLGEICRGGKSLNSMGFGKQIMCRPWSSWEYRGPKLYVIKVTMTARDDGTAGLFHTKLDQGWSRTMLGITDILHLPLPCCSGAEGPPEAGL